jgi:hypothetical protein
MEPDEKIIQVMPKSDWVKKVEERLASKIPFE